MADFNFVLPRLAVGAAVSNADDVAQLVAAGVGVVIDGRGEFDDAPLLAGHPDITYVWNGTADDGQPKPASWFGKALDVALPAYAKPHVKVYYHCAAGVNRGPSLCYAHLRALGIPANIAEGVIRAVRPQVGLRYKADADAAMTTLGYA